MFDDEKKELGYFETVNGESMAVLGLDEMEIDGEDEIFIVIRFRNAEHNLLLQTEVFPRGESPYNSGDILKVPYFVVENHVYYLDDVFEINKNIIE